MSVRTKQALLLLAGIALVLLGLFRNEAHEVMQKAIFVCMECIGIG